MQLRRQRAAFLQAFLFLRRQALDFKNHRLNFLVQQPVRILQRVELAFARGNGHFLLAQFRLRLLQAGLQFRLLAQQRAARRLASATRFCNSVNSDCSSVIWFLRPRMEAGALGLPWPFK
jgi:hypothetical protein